MDREGEGRRTGLLEPVVKVQQAPPCCRKRQGAHDEAEDRCAPREIVSSASAQIELNSARQRDALKTVKDLKTLP